MKVALLTVLLAVGAFCNPAPTQVKEPAMSDESYDVSVVEGDVFLRERLTMLSEGLQKIEVPHHHNLEHVEVYLDFTNNIEVTKYVDLKKCQISTLSLPPIDIQEERDGLEYAKKHIYSLAEATEKKFSRVETPEELTDLRFLRQELQEACSDVPSYLTDVIEITNNTSSEPFLMHGTKAQYDNLVHRQRRQTQLAFSCPYVHFNQKCKVYSSAYSCYWFVTCKLANTVGKGCLSHLQSGNIDCKVCCTDPKAPRDPKALFKHCDVLNW